MADNIKLVTFAGSTVTPQDDALVYETAIAQSGIIYGTEVTLKSNNTLHIAAGHGIICGRKFTIIESDIAVQLTGGSVYFGRLYVHLDLSNTTEPIQLMTETAASLTGVVQQENVNINNGIYEFNLATFEIDASTISNVVDVFPVVSGQNTEEVEKMFVKKTDILKSIEEVEANTDADKVVGPEAVAELNKNLGSCTFSVQDDGAYVTYTPTGGADPVTKKLGEPTIINVGYVKFSGNGAQTQTLDVSAVYADYKKLTLANFVPIDGFYASANSADIGWGNLDSYDPSTGTLSVSATINGSGVVWNVQIPIYIAVN